MKVGYSFWDIYSDFKMWKPGSNIAILSPEFQGVEGPRLEWVAKPPALALKARAVSLEQASDRVTGRARAQGVISNKPRLARAAVRLG